MISNQNHSQLGGAQPLNNHLCALETLKNITLSAKIFLFHDFKTIKNPWGGLTSNNSPICAWTIHRGFAPSRNPFMCPEENIE